jgi:hypothetical protein
MESRSDRQRAGSGMVSIDVWTFPEELGIGIGDLSGFSVEATDGGIGKVDEATYEAGGSYLVVDTGPWIFGKKVLLPAGVVERVDPDTETVFVNLTKDEIKNSPEFDEDAYRDQTYRDRVGDYYGRR